MRSGVFLLIVLGVLVLCMAGCGAGSTAGAMEWDSGIWDDATWQ